MSMHRLFCSLLVAASFSIAAACGSSGSSGPPDCDQLVDHFIDVAGSGDRDAFLDQCESLDLTDEQARCIAAAEHVVDFDDCGVSTPSRVAQVRK
jgi:hypothetical protein